MATRAEIYFDANGEKLFAWLYRAVGGGPGAPLIVMSHGFSAVIEMGLAPYAEAFVAAGFHCLVYEHRNYGRSSGWPRNESDPWQQVEDMRAAISFGRGLPFVDPARIGLWGTSYAGGHVLTVTALDKRVACAVAQVPLVSGQRNFEAWVPADKRARFLDRLARDRDARARGEAPGVTPAALPGSETEEWAKAVDPKKIYANEVTLRSLDLMRSYEPVIFAERVAPTPFLMIVGDRDSQTPVAWQREAFARIGEPKRLISLPGRHYDPYLALLPQSIEAARDWFTAHLKSAN
jgi:fermentation-respiration switch protein FrsA (DUF1100 family)